MNDERGMKKWNPFFALDNMNATYRKAIKNKQKISKPLLSDEQISEINYQLNNCENTFKTITYYQDGFIETVKGYCHLLKNLNAVQVDNIIISYENILNIN